MAAPRDSTGDLLPRRRRVDVRGVDWHNHRVMTTGCRLEAHTVWYVLSRPLLFRLRDFQHVVLTSVRERLVYCIVTINVLDSYFVVLGLIVT